MYLSLRPRSQLATIHYVDVSPEDEVKEMHLHNAGNNAYAISRVQDALVTDITVLFMDTLCLIVMTIVP